MPRIIHNGTDPVDAGRRIFYKNETEVNEGFTVLVGCNGAGKSTFLTCIESELQSLEIPVIKFDNLCDGGQKAYGDQILKGDMTGLAGWMVSSEGENLKNSIGMFITTLRPFIENGYREKDERYRDLFNDKSETDKRKERLKSCSERWVLLDAADSGLSIDIVLELKKFFKEVVIDKNKDKNIYIVVSANEYEMAKDENCLDVQSNKYTRFSSYEDFRDFILKSREKKNNSYNK